jgi:hypothetical protein
MKTVIETRLVTVATTATQLVGPNPNRVGVLLSAPPTNRYTFSWMPAAVLDQGVTLFPTDVPYKLLESEIGSAIEQPISAISAAADQVVAVTEINRAP